LSIYPVVFFLALAINACLSSPLGAATPGASDWVKGEKSRVRLISEGGLTSGIYWLGIEIELVGQALTYWRNPGEAGLPPRFEFNSSRNLAKSEVLFPAPSRILEAGVEAFGYQRHVILPVKITPKLAAQSVAIDLQFSYAICESICIPGQVHLQFELFPNAPAQTGPLTLARQKVPVSVAAKDFVHIRPLPADKTKPLWSVDLIGKPEIGEDLFAEGPEGWYFDTARVSEQSFTLTLAEKPANGRFPLKDMVLTLARPDRAFEMRLELPAP
jgi:DsbC/DsbD-like thiol-disulfide interchange protein